VSREVRKESQTSGATPISIRAGEKRKPSHGARSISAPSAHWVADASRTRRTAASAATLELLEHRRLFTVTVTEGFPGFFEIDGSEGADNIDVQVSQPSQTITVAGIGTFANVQHVTVYGFGGDDTISVTNVSGSGTIGAAILAGGGDDSITTDLDAGVWGGDGNDIIRISDSYRAQAYGEAGDDSVFVRGACADADIRGGDGNDLIDCTSSTVFVVAFGDAGNDTLYGSQYADQLYGGSGDDVLYSGPNDEAASVAHASLRASARTKSAAFLGDTFDGGGDNDTVVFLDNSGLPDISNTESVVVSACTISFADDAADNNGAAVNFSAVDGADVTFLSTQHLGDLCVQDSDVAVQQDGSIVLDLRTIEMSGAAHLDLADNAMIVRDEPVGSWDGAAYTGLIGYVAAGRRDGGWDGDGIITSMPAAIEPSTLTTLGIAPAADAANFGGAQTALWMGQTVDASSVLVKYTRAGDANLDGHISGDDYDVLDSSFSQALQGYWRGDFNYDGVINGDDYALTDANSDYAV